MGATAAAVTPALPPPMPDGRCWLELSFDDERSPKTSAAILDFKPSKGASIAEAILKWLDEPL